MEAAQEALRGCASKSHHGNGAVERAARAITAARADAFDKAAIADQAACNEIQRAVRADERRKAIDWCISFIEGGHFLHDAAPPKLFAKEVVGALRRAIATNEPRQ